ncbi:O-acyltransferase WSD1 isoform X2 [Helianthus annuus]|uniref:O-acyltransferase WSD1 isoform X2 n=1 Tax=Helianthus annuus TaxID=4232 RepID=UPI001652E445|nr:O-acyltransferase WSD1 isoform X2 [Helianthus annuus]
MFQEYKEEPLTPAGRLFIQPETNISVICCLGTHEPLRIDAIKSVIADSMLAKHPRLSSILVVDKNGHEYWRKTEIDMNRHIIFHNDPIEGAKDDQDAANILMADLAVSVPFETDKPLWELHLLISHKCAVIRAHHALGDGVSLLSFFLAMCRKADDPEKMPSMNPVVVTRSNGGGEAIGGILWRLLKLVWFTVVFVVDFIARVLWVRDETTVVSGGAGVELWPRKLVTARFLIDDMKIVKKYIPNTDLEELMRDPKAGWGNKFGMLVLPTYYHKSGSDPLEYLRRAKAMIDQKKSSLESFFSYKFGYLIMSILGAKYASLLNYRILCNTTFTISNVVGPKEKLTFAGHPVDYIKTTSSSLPHAITMHMVSYAGTAYMQILVAKDLVHDPEVLAKCLEDAMLEMKEAALPKIKRK